MNRNFLMAVLFACAVPSMTMAQGEPPPRDFGGPPPQGGGGPGREMVDRWLERLKERNPEEYDRLIKLRQDDPEAFRMELHKRLEHERDNRMKGGGPDGPGMMPGGPEHEPNPEVDAMKLEARKIAASYKAATSEEDKAKIKAELKKQVTSIFDLREKQREEEIARFDEHLTELKARLEKRKANRDQIIERKMQELIEPEDLSL